MQIIVEKIVTATICFILTNAVFREPDVPSSVLLAEKNTNQGKADLQNITENKHSCWEVQLRLLRNIRIDLWNAPTESR